MKTRLILLKYRNLQNCLCGQFPYQELPICTKSNLLKELYLAPFKKENILTPITGLMAGLALASIGGSYFIREHSLANVHRMAFLDRNIPRNEALAIYGPIGFAQGWGTGVNEEYKFRNWLMPLLDYKLGQ